MSLRTNAAAIDKQPPSSGLSSFCVGVWHVQWGVILMLTEAGHWNQVVVRVRAWTQHLPKLLSATLESYLCILLVYDPQISPLINIQHQTYKNIQYKHICLFNHSNLHLSLSWSSSPPVHLQRLWKWDCGNLWYMCLLFPHGQALLLNKETDSNR